MGTSWQQRLTSLFLAVVVLLGAASLAQAETRTLKLYFLHTKERAEITYYRNGRYLPGGLRKINRFLRDWRRNEPTKMDRRLLDLVWEAYRKSGSRKYIHVISAYRSPKTNSMLRKRGRGVAKKSQHMLGRALDFYLPDVKLRKLRNIGLRIQGGGVGYYPRSGSPFVHFDVGRVRHWPRMNRKQLVSVFPRGRTLHVPSDGKPLPGYKQAMAAYKRRKQSGGTVQLARTEPTPRPTPANRENDRGFLTALFTGGADEEEESTPQPRVAVRQQAPAPEPAAVPEPAVTVASLPLEDIPLPREAPRPVAIALAEPDPVVAEPVPEEPVAAEPVAAEPVAVEVAAAEPAAPEPDSIPFQVVAASAQPEGIFADVPVPAFRPTLREQDASITVADARLSGVTETELPPATMTLAALDRPNALARAQAVLNELRLRDASVDDAVGTIPVARPTSPLPAPAPQDIQAEDRPLLVPIEKPRTRQSEVVVAALPQERPKPSAALKPAVLVLPSDRPVIEAKKPRIKFEPAAPASQRFALLSRTPGTSAELAIATGVKTAPKAAKPSLLDQKPDPKPVVIPVEFGTTLTSWALRGYSAGRGRDGSRMNAFIPRANRSAPTAVYTAGFQRERFGGETNRFFGSAVKFLSVAKFSRTN